MLFTGSYVGIRRRGHDSFSLRTIMRDLRGNHSFRSFVGYSIRIMGVLVYVRIWGRWVIGNHSDIREGVLLLCGIGFISEFSNVLWCHACVRTMYGLPCLCIIVFVQWTFWIIGSTIQARETFHFAKYVLNYQRRRTGRISDIVRRDSRDCV